MAGSPTKLTEENMAEMERRFREGATVLEAIDGLMSEATYYAHQSSKPEFAARMELAREYITEIARGVVAKAIKRGDRDSSKWWLERKNKKEFSTRTELTGKDGEQLMPKPILGGASAVNELPANDSDQEASPAQQAD